MGSGGEGGGWARLESIEGTGQYAERTLALGSPAQQQPLDNATVNTFISHSACSRSIIDP